MQVCATVLLSLTLVQVESYTFSTPAIAPPANNNVPYNLANYANSYTANLASRAITAPLPASLETAPPSSPYADPRFYNPFLAEQARIAAAYYAYNAALRAAASAIPTAAPAAAFSPQPPTAAAVATPEFYSVAPTLAAPAASVAATVATAAPAAVASPAVAAALPETAPAALTAADGSPLTSQVGGVPGASYAYELRQASSLPGSSYNLPYSPYVGSG